MAATFAESGRSLDLGTLVAPSTKAAARLQDTGLTGCPRWDDVDHLPEPGPRSARYPVAMTHAGYLMDRAADAIGEGRSFPLGAVTLTADGFRLRGRAVTWHQVREVGNGQAGELMVHLREGRPLRVATGALTNPHTFAALRTKAT